ncbi:MAG: sugar transferase [Ahrensia sp.]
MIKRLFDIVASAGGLVLLSPLIGCIWLLVLMRDGSPALFAQQRAGRNGVAFTCYKFRTMRTGAAQVATHLADDAMISPLGKTLRRFKLDELPQLYNVLKGDMSLVGPRPSLLTQTELIDERRVRGVLALRPGITGLSQVRGIDMRDPIVLADSDADYLEQATLTNDLSLIIKTVTGQTRH